MYKLERNVHNLKLKGLIIITFQDINHLRLPTTPIYGLSRRQSHPQTHSPTFAHEDENGWERAHAKKSSIPASESFVGGAGDLFRGCYGALDPQKNRGQPILALKRCLPETYWSGKNMARLIRVSIKVYFY